jgi:hypothetical protein
MAQRTYSIRRIARGPTSLTQPGNKAQVKEGKVRTTS